MTQPPGPRGLPYIGCLDGLLRNPMKFWSRIAATYGGLACVPLKGGKLVYLVSDPDVLYELLITKRHKYRKNTRYRAAVALFGEGLLLNENEAWKRQRLVTQPAFKTEHIAAQMDWMTQLIERFLSGWQDRVDAQGECRVDVEFLQLSQLLAGRYLFGADFEKIADRFCAAAIAVKEAWPEPPRNVVQAMLRRTPGWSTELAAAIARIDACVYEYLAEHRARDFEDCGVLTMLAHAGRERGDEISDQSLRDQLLSLFFAGHETSAMSLSWIHYLLHEHPDVRRKLQAEVVDALGAGSPTSDGLGRLRYTEQVINESLRLYSPIHSISRVALEDDTLGGYSIPKDSTIYVSLYATHRLSQFWPDPERFDPERFTAERCKSRARFAFIPFAAGHRNCIGGSMAMVELKLVVALLAQRYELDLVPGQVIEAAPGTTVHPRYGMRMRLRQLQMPTAAPSAVAEMRYGS